MVRRFETFVHASVAFGKALEASGLADRITDGQAGAIEALGAYLLRVALGRPARYSRDGGLDELGEIAWWIRQYAPVLSVGVRSWPDGTGRLVVETQAEGREGLPPEGCA